MVFPDEDSELGVATLRVLTPVTISLVLAA